MIAAKRVFSLKGFNKATMEDIANEAELSPGTLYLYFKNKDELCASLSLRILQYLNIKLKYVSSEKELEPEQKIEALKEAMYDVYEFDPLILINMLHLQSSEVLKNLSSQLVSDIKELSNNSIETMADIFEDGIKKNVFIDKKPVAFAEILWALFSGVVLCDESKEIIKSNKGNKNYLKLTLENAFEIFARGIKK